MTIPDALCEVGRFGRKTNNRYHRYEPGAKRRTSDPEVHSIIGGECAKKGISAHALGEEEIVDRAIAGINNEADKVIEEGTVSRPSDIDVALIHGYGFPRYCGYPVFWAQQADTDEIY